MTTPGIPIRQRGGEVPAERTSADSAAGPPATATDVAVVSYAVERVNEVIGLLGRIDIDQDAAGLLVLAVAKMRAFITDHTVEAS